MSRDVFIISAARTAIGKFGGTLSGVPAPELGRIVVNEVINRAGLTPDSGFDEVILGNVLSAGLGQNCARQALINAGIPETVPATSVNKVCGSGLKAITLGVQAIKSGDADMIIAGGTENMSAAPFLLNKARWGYRMGNSELVDSMIYDGLWEIFNNYHMGITAENIAEKYDISREAQDEFSFNSQQKAAAAIENGDFESEIVPVEIPQRKKDPLIFKTDEFPRPETTIETLSKLRPAFKKDGTVTAGNASGINDSSAAVILVSEDKLNELGISPIAKVVSYASCGVNPAYMGMGPSPSSKKALEKSGWTTDDVELFELNEAFASQSLAVIKELSIKDRIKDINIHGGAISLGHPIGASGARILVTLLYAMKKRKANKGLASLCIGGGQGIAMTVEM